MTQKKRWRESERRRRVCCRRKLRFCISTKIGPHTLVSVTNPCRSTRGVSVLSRKRFGRKNGAGKVKTGVSTKTQGGTRLKLRKTSWVFPDKVVLHESDLCADWLHLEKFTGKCLFQYLCMVVFAYLRWYVCSVSLYSVSLSRLLCKIQYDCRAGGGIAIVKNDTSNGKAKPVKIRCRIYEVYVSTTNKYMPVHWDNQTAACDRVQDLGVREPLLFCFSSAIDVDVLLRIISKS